MRRRVATVLPFMCALLFGGTTTPAVPVSDAHAAVSEPIPGGPYFDEHRYRVVGKLRLLLFWMGNEVGSARMTARNDDASTTLTLLVGSDPERAPRNLNEWSYLREEVRPAQADVFALRSLDAAEDAAHPTGPAADGQSFWVSCSSVRQDAVRSVLTKVNARGMTYRMFNPLLEHIATSARWEEHQMVRPSGSAAGFLTAMQYVIRAGRTDPRSLKHLTPVTYVYNNAVYDLSVRGNDWLGRTTIGGRTFEQLIRTDFSIRNRTTGEISRFAVTYSSDRTRSALPVQIFYQLSFWLRIELRLDDEVDVPTDPAEDRSTLSRIRAVCAVAGSRTTDAPARVP